MGWSPTSSPRTVEETGRRGRPGPSAALSSNSDDGWKAIAEDLRLDLLDAEPEASPGVVERWDRNVPKSRPERFWEVALNVCDGRRLAAVVAARAADLASLGPMTWWDHADHAGAVDDLRDAFARLAPLAPIDEQSPQRRPELDGGPPRDAAAARPTDRGSRLLGRAPLGSASTGCRRTSSATGSPTRARRFGVLDWTAKLPLSSLPIDDRYRMIAWVLFKIEDPSALDVDRVGHWLVGAGLVDVDRILPLAGRAGGPGRRLAQDRTRPRPALARELARRDGPGARRRERRGSAENPGGTRFRRVRGDRLSSSSCGPEAPRRVGGDPRGPSEITVDGGQGERAARGGRRPGRDEDPRGGRPRRRREDPRPLEAADPGQGGGRRRSSRRSSPRSTRRWRRRASAASEIAGVGVGSPGPLDIDSGVILFSANLNVRNFAARARACPRRWAGR